VRTRREVLRLGLLAGLGTAGCSPSLSLFRDTWNAPSLSSKDYGTNPETVRETPYAALGVDLYGERYETILVSADQGRLLWASSEHKLFTTQDGRLVRTQGQDRDLLETHWQQPDPLLQAARSGSLPARGVYRTVDLRSGSRVEKNVAVESRFEILGEESVVILAEAHDCIKLRETAQVRSWRWEARQTFWVGKDDPVVWRSQQRYCPEVEAIGLEILKKPAV
jgi:hypothetical protein